VITERVFPLDGVSVQESGPLSASGAIAVRIGGLSGGRRAAGVLNGSTAAVGLAPDDGSAEPTDAGFTATTFERVAEWPPFTAPRRNRVRRRTSRWLDGEVRVARLPSRSRGTGKSTLGASLKRLTRPTVRTVMSPSPLEQLSNLGQSVWVDFLSRQALQDGTIDRLMREDAVVGLTSNPTIFQKAIADGDAYNEQLHEVLKREADGKEVFLALAQQDVRDACDLLRKTWEHTGHLDGQVSLEVDPRLAYDGEGTIAEARRLHEMIDRQNLYVKIPATKPGLGAIEATIAAGIPVNVTLIFSLKRHREVIEAYLKGLESLLEAGGDPSDVPSVASFFISRVDIETNRRLDAIGGYESLRNRLAVANAKLAYAQYQEAFSGARWGMLLARGARPQRCLWASTSVKDPDLPDTMYVEQLVGTETVNTMPPETLRAMQHHGKISGPTITEHLDEARDVLSQLQAAGVNYDEVASVLEEEGVQNFMDSFESLFKDVEAKRDALAATR
jgi:transaldolase